MDQPVSSNNPREVARNRFAEGERLLRFQQFTAAAAVFAEVGRLAPDVAAAPFNEGNAWFAAHQYAQAADAYRRSLAIEADPDAWNNLGNSLAALRQWADAASALRKATELNPRLPAAWSNLGKVMSQLGQPADALNCFLQAANLEPRNWRTLSNLAQIRAQQGAFEDALLSIQRACEVAPDIADVHVSRGGILRRLNRWRDARDAYQRALELAPNNPYVLSNLGELHRAVGEIESAKQYFAVALQDRQAPPETYDNFLLTLLYDDTIDADELWMQHRAWGELNQDVDNHTSAPAPVLGSAGERSEQVKVSLKPPADDRLLRIGYLSADFRLHPVGYLLEPVWQAHDRQRWQVVAYANSLILDQHTACLRELADEWHWVAHESDADLAERIRRDRIDILIDLSGHTGGNRLQVFRERPARLQASWFGYSSTTGLAQIDHVICDAWTVPPHDEPYFSERPLRLPQCYACFPAPRQSPPAVRVSESQSNGRVPVVLGSLNILAKVSPSAIKCWAELLQMQSHTVLLLKSPVLADPAVQQLVRERFAAYGIGPERLRLEGPGSRVQMLETYQRIDIALDPFPFGGGITTLEALWMGVPVVSLRGDRFAGRATASFLRTLELDSLVTDTLEDYKHTVVKLIADDAYRIRLRSELRERMLASAIGDTGLFTREYESTLRSAWLAKQ